MKHTLHVLAILSLCASVAHADDPVIEASPPPEAPGMMLPGAPAGFSYKLYGFLRLKGGFTQDDPNVQFVGRNDGFTLQNARLGVLGSWSRLAFRFSADGAVDERAGANATVGTLRFALKDAFLDIRILDQLSVRVVRFETIFDLEEYIPYTERAFVDRSLESRGVLATQGFEAVGLSPGRSIGVALRSDQLFAAGPAVFGYEAAVQNGNGEFSADNDNDSFAFSLALFAKLDRSFLFLAGRQKTRTVGELPFRQTQSDFEGAAGALVRVGPIEAAAQILARHTTFPTTGGPEQNSFGAHAQLGYGFDLADGKLRLQPAYRYAILDPSDLISTDLVQEHTFDISLRFMTLPIRVQFDFTHVVEQAGRELANDRGEVGFEVAL